MSRKEEREAVAKNKYPYIKGLPQSSSHQAIFIEAAEWADATMLDKVCKWLKENVEYAVMKKNGKHTIELAGIELAEDLQKDMRI